ncbi:MAG: hypothetical protein AAF704_16435 [Cyanobacteria bacterium P01_D01_bin.123]
MAVVRTSIVTVTVLSAVIPFRPVERSRLISGKSPTDLTGGIDRPSHQMFQQHYDAAILSSQQTYA